MRLIDFFDRGFSQHPDSPCLTDGDTTFTYRQVWHATHCIANRLNNMSMPDNAVVATLFANHVNAMVAILGVLRAGKIWMPLNTRNAAVEVGNSLRTHGACFAFVDEESACLIESTSSNLAGLCFIDSADKLNTLHHWIEQGDPSPVDVPQSSDTVIAIRSTGGTTGPSKGVMVTNRVYATMYANFFSTLPVQETPIHLAAAPLSHAAGALCFPTMAFGGLNVILHKAAPEAILPAIEKYRITHLFLPPTVIYMLLDSPLITRHDYSSLNYLIYSAAPMSVSRLKEAMQVFGPVMTQAYGQAEAPFFCCVVKPEEHRLATEIDEKRLASCGRATPFTRIAIMDDDGRILGPEQIGEVVIKGDMVMKGYHLNPEATAAVSTHGWHHTGDMGYLDMNGYLYLVDRKRDVIISGGFNIYPGEIEQILWSHPAITDCAVIGVPDPLWGEAIKAVVQLKPQATATEKELIELCWEKLGKMKSPKTVEFWSQLPRSTVGKVLKRDIRAQFWTQEDRKI